MSINENRNCGYNMDDSMYINDNCGCNCDCETERRIDCEARREMINKIKNQS